MRSTIVPTDGAARSRLTLSSRMRVPLFAAGVVALLVCTSMPAQSAPLSGWGTAGPIESEDSGHAYFVDLAVSAGGRALAVWELWDGVGKNVMANRYDPPYGWGSPVFIATAAGGDAYSPTVGVDGNGSGVAMWVQWDGYQPGVFVKPYKAGAGWDYSYRLVENNDTDAAADLKMDMDGKGNAIAVWTMCCSESRVVFASRLVAGAGWGVAQRVNVNQTGEASDLQVELDAAGNGVVTWRLFNGTWGFYGASYDGGGGWSEPVQLETAPAVNAEEPDLDVGEQGDAVAIWVREDGGLRNVFANRFRPGAGWGGPELVRPSLENFFETPTVAVDGSGTAVVVMPEVDSSDWVITTSRNTVGGAWEALATIYRGADPPVDPALAFDARGQGVLAVNLVSIWGGMVAATYDAVDGWGPLGSIDYDAPDGVGHTYSGTGPLRMGMDAEGNAITVWTKLGPIQDIWANRFIKPDTTPPPLVVGGPDPYFVTQESSVEVWGTTEPGARVTVNGAEATVSAVGSFNIRIALSAGANLIQTTATDASGNSATELRLVTFDDPVVQLESNLSEAQAAVVALERALHESQADLNATHANLTAAEQGIAAAEANVTGLQAAIAALEADVVAAEASLAAANAQLTEAQAQLSQAQGKITTLESDGNASAAATANANAESRRASDAAGGASGLAVLGVVLGAAGVGVGALATLRGNQASRVQVQGWDPKKKEPIQGQAEGGRPGSAASSGDVEGESPKP